MWPRGSVYLLRESTEDFDHFYEKVIVACTIGLGHMVTFDLENGETVTYQLDRYNEEQWMKHIRSIKGSTAAVRRMSTMRASRDRL